MVRRNYISADGVVHIRDITERKPERRNKAGELYSAEAAEICLRCEKKNCSGSAECYAKHNQKKKK